MRWRKEQTPEGGRARQPLKGGGAAGPRLSHPLQQRGGHRAMGMEWKEKQHTDERSLLYDQSSFACGRPTAHLWTADRARRTQCQRRCPLLPHPRREARGTPPVCKTAAAAALNGGRGRPGGSTCSENGRVKEGGRSKTKEENTCTLTNTGHQNLWSDGKA